jgi:hypothetical protein
VGALVRGAKEKKARLGEHAESLGDSDTSLGWLHTGSVNGAKNGAKLADWIQNKAGALNRWPRGEAALDHLAMVAVEEKCWMLQDSKGRSVLGEVIRWGAIKAVELLVQAGADPSWRAEDGETLLMSAAGRADEASVRAMLQRGADPNPVDDHGFSALMRAAREGHIECVKALVEAGADVNAVQPLGWPALMHAVLHDHVEVALLLLEAGADLGLRDDEGQGPMDLAAHGQKRCLPAMESFVLNLLVLTGQDKKAGPRL